MPDSAVSYDEPFHVARLAPRQSDRLEVEQSLRAAITAAEQSPDSHQALAAALVRLGELKRDQSSNAEAEELFHRAVDVGERTLGPDDLSLVPALTGLAAMRIAQGAPHDAVELFTRALAISEHALGHDHPDLVVLLNDLSRLFLKQSAPASAEPLLLRLYAIKRVKGEEHPEVATVLASLAAVRQALGRHDAAEQLWRRVVAIRERTLAPNHFAVATAIEHLAEACAARGKLDEALRLFQRSLSMREITLDAGHASLRILRERIADVQLQASEEALFGESPNTPIGPELPVGVPSALLAPTLGEAPDLGGGDSRSTGKDARAYTAQAEQSRIEPRSYLSWAPMSASPSRGAENGASGSGLPGQSAPGWPLASVIMPAFVGDFTPGPHASLSTEAPVSRDGARLTLTSLMTRLHRRPTPLVTASAAAIVLFLLTVGAVSHARSRTEQVMSSEPLAARATEPDVPAVVGDSVSRPRSTINGSLGRIGERGAAPSSRTAARSLPSPVQPRSSGRSTASREASVEPPGSPLPPVPTLGDIARVLPGAIGARLDSVTRVASGSVSGDAIRARASVASSDWVPITANALPDTGGMTQPAQLIGSLPRAPYPEELRAKRIEGKVVVEFWVDTSGRPDMATLTVLQSDHELFTSAVRKLIPFTRFVPGQDKGEKIRSRVRIPVVFALNRD